MELTVMDRMVILNALPPEGDIITLRIMRDLKGGLSFSEDELATIGFVMEEGNVVRGWERDITKDVEVGAQALALIVESFKKLNDKKALHPDFLPTYEKFLDA